MAFHRNPIWSSHQISNIQQNNYRRNKASPCKLPSFEALSGLVASAIQTLVSPQEKAEPLFAPPIYLPAQENSPELGLSYH